MLERIGAGLVAAVVISSGFAADSLAQQQPGMTGSVESLSSAIKRGAGGNELLSIRTQVEKSRHAAQLQFLAANGADIDQLNRPWEIFLKGLIDKLSLGDGKTIQVPTAPQPADWAHPQFGVWRTNFYGDAMPKWGFTFQPQNASSFASTYGTFINSIVLNLTGPDVDKANAARDKWANCVNGLANRQQLVGKHWTDFNNNQQSLPANRRLSFDAWYARYEGPIIGAQTQQCQQLAIDYNQYFNKATQGQAGLANAIIKYSSDSAQAQAQVPETDRKEMVYTYSVVQSLDEFVKAAEAAPGFAWDQKFDKSSGTYSSSSSSWGGSASYGLFFRVSASGSSVTIDTTHQDFSMGIQLKGLQTFDVRPGQWFSQDLVRFFAKGPFQPNSPIKRAYDSGTLYGENGIFSLRTARIIVAYKPKVTLHLANSNYHEARSSWSGSGGLGIGPFSFGVGASGSSVNINFDDQSNTIVAQDLSNVPQIIAVVTDVLPEFK